MKSIVKYWLLASIILPMGFTTQSCEKGNEDIGDHKLPEEIGSDNDSPSPEKSSGNYVLLSVKEKTRLSSGTTITTICFENPVYEVNNWNGKTVLKSYDKYRDSPYCTFTYALPNRIDCNSTIGDIECTINTAGLISQEKIGHQLNTYKYDSKNRLTEVKKQYGTEVQVEQLTYDNTYNLVSYKRIREDKILDEATIEYTTIPAKSIPLQSLDISFGNIFSAFCNWDLLEMGFYGNTIPLNLVKRILYTSSGEEAEKVYEYTLNESGYVVEIVEMDYRASNTFITTWNFEWKEVSIPSYSNWLFSDVGSPYYRYLQ
jgi:hypothetical protein